MQAFFVLLAILAVAAWLVAAASAVTILGRAPSGGRFATLMDLGWWRFSAIEGRIGPASRAPVARYRKAFLVFFACVLAAIATTLALAPNTAASS
nr:hypothetical protein [Mesorhizobium sp.]